MSGHKYKFGDRVMYDGMNGPVPAVVTGIICGDAYWVNREREGSARAICSELTPGWPEDEDGEFVTVRAAVAVDSGGGWTVAGDIGWDDDTAAEEASSDYRGPAVDVFHFIEARVPLPKPQTIQAKVVEP